MSIIAVNIADGIRVDQATQKGSVHDVVHLICQKPGNYASQTFLRLEKVFPELTPKWCKISINGKGKETPVADAATLVEIAWLLPGKKAAGAESVCGILDGDLSLMDEIQRRHAQVAGTGEEGFLLAGNHGAIAQVALSELPYSLEQLQQMQAAPTPIVASKEGIQQCSVVLHEFPMAKYSQYIELKGREMVLKEKDFDIDSKLFGLKQKEHFLRMDRETAELEDPSAKRRRFNPNSDDGITFRSLLAKAAQGVRDAVRGEGQAA
ncbi:hypothetical protein ABBQ32_012246 [Trebouxia sp. C0010 RCD-2024]